LDTKTSALAIRKKPQTEAQGAKLARLRGGAVLVTAEERAAVEAALGGAVAAWRKRRGIFRGAWCVRRFFGGGGG
jgi:hypothetical protein